MMLMIVSDSFTKKLAGLIGDNIGNYSTYYLGCLIFVDGCWDYELTDHVFILLGPNSWL